MTNRITHISIVWGITLAVITLVEWRSLDRNPLEQQILSPFIERDIAVSQRAPTAVDPLDLQAAEQKQGDAVNSLQYDVQFHFNGPLFLACFFGPVLAAHGIGLLITRLKRS